ncbi:hypothetical protein AMOR_49840 [Anaeromyxobacter oryzae]|uniref:Uncharacterized protein n=1 Tax=Anaeromyxobacter oryzae TaxID=2918170 RepID=A0ABN6N1T8_9BACT|nr:hypothetical protein AMOR_49840 [Anaeromyxobacter oryzae]
MIRYRCELTSELLDRAEPELDAALWTFNERVYEATRRRIPRRALRIAGMALAAAGILRAWALIVLTPECSRRSLALPYASLPLFVILGTVFAFERSFTVRLRARMRAVTARRAHRLLEAVRRHAPYETEYVFSGTRLEAHASKLALHRVTELGSIQEAIAGDRLACLFTRRWPGRLRRVVWLPDPAARTAVLAALRRAGVAVTELRS